MIVIRPITRQDFNIFAEFSFESLLGITSLPRNRDKFLETIIHSETSFSRDVSKPGDEIYYFVLEDLTTGRIGGTCGIIIQSQHSHGYFYQLESIATNAKHIAAPHEIQVLKVASCPTHCSEICALYLQPTFRHSGQGRLLSLSRFLFMAAHRKRFEKKILANLRGYIDESQVAPFWEAIGSHFCHLSFVEMMAQLEETRVFISEILPKHPIYISLLPKEAQETLGKIHEQTKPALNMLLNENFSVSPYIDVFDGGPILMTNTSHIRAIKNSEVITIDLTTDPLLEEEEYILSNERLDFRACFGMLKIISKKQAILNEKVAEALCVKSGDKIRYVTMH